MKEHYFIYGKSGITLRISKNLDRKLETYPPASRIQLYMGTWAGLLEIDDFCWTTGGVSASSHFFRLNDSSTSLVVWDFYLRIIFYPRFYRSLVLVKFLVTRNHINYRVWKINKDKFQKTTRCFQNYVDLFSRPILNNQIILFFFF